MIPEKSFIGYRPFNKFHAFDWHIQVLIMQNKFNTSNLIRSFFLDSGFDNLLLIYFIHIFSFYVNTIYLSHNTKVGTP